MSQQPFQPGQQPGGYQQPGQSGYPPQGGYQQGGYQQPPPPQQQQQPGYGNYPGAPSQFGGPSSAAGAGNPLNNPTLVAMILQIAGIVVAVIGVIGSFFAFAIDGYPGSLKFVTFSATIVAALGFGGVLIGLSHLVKTKTP